MPEITAPSNTSAVDSVKERAKEAIMRDMGDIMLNALRDPKTVEIILNADGALWQEKLGEQLTNIGKLRPAQALGILQKVAGFHEKIINTANPIIEGEFPVDNSRFAGLIPPAASAPIFAIRKKAVAVWALEQYVEQGIMSNAHKDVIMQAVAQHLNILVIGGTGSGKTTLINAIIAEIVRQKPTERLVIIEDTGEIQCTAVNHIQLHSTIDVTMTKLLKITLRLRPDRILVGEVRGPEALDLIMAWNTGHPGGAATVHANSCEEGLDRLITLVSMHANKPSDIPPLVAKAANVLVHIARTETGRVVRDIIGVNGFRDGVFDLVSVDRMLNEAEHRQKMMKEVMNDR